MSPPAAIGGSQPVRLIEVPKKFHHTLGRFPKQIARGTMTLLGRLAAGGPAAFQGVVRLKQRPDTLRARIGIHRLLFRLKTDAIHVVDLIPRQDLERRIKCRERLPRTLYRRASSFFQSKIVNRHSSIYLSPSRIRLRPAVVRVTQGPDSLFILISKS